MEQDQNAPDAATSAPAAASDKAHGSSPIVKIGIVAGLMIVQIVAAYFVQKMFFFDNTGATAKAATVEKKAEKHDEEKPTKVVMLDELVINPAGTGGRRYLAVTMGLQMRVDKTKKAEGGEGGEGGAKGDDGKKALLRDALISLLSSKHLDELSSVAYRDTLKMEIRDAINKQLKDSSVVGVVFSNYVLQ